MKDISQKLITILKLLEVLEDQRQSLSFSNLKTLKRIQQYEEHQSIKNQIILNNIQTIMNHTFHENIKREYHEKIKDQHQSFSFSNLKTLKNSTL